MCGMSFNVRSIKTLLKQRKEYPDTKENLCTRSLDLTLTFNNNTRTSIEFEYFGGPHEIGPTVDTKTYIFRYFYYKPF